VKQSTLCAGLASICKDNSYYRLLFLSSIGAHPRFLPSPVTGIARGIFSALPPKRNQHSLAISRLNRPLGD
jgi:hypothetical protein